jgi:HAD superfamily hydrolase (TIGR01509 family)
MDGLMLDTEPLYKAAWQGASAELGFDLSDATYGRLIGRPTRECEAELLRIFGSDFPIAEFQTRWPNSWRAIVKERGITLKPGLPELLNLFDTRKIPVAIATSTDAEFTGLSLQRTGLTHRFPVLVTVEQVKRSKPAPDIYLEAARRLDKRPSACWALEDSDVGVLAASAAGMTTICVPDLKAPSQLAAQAAFRVLGSLSEVHELIKATLSSTETVDY